MTSALAPPSIEFEPWPPSSSSERAVPCRSRPRSRLSMRNTPSIRGQPSWLVLAGTAGEATVRATSTAAMLDTSLSSAGVPGSHRSACRDRLLVHRLPGPAQLGGEVLELGEAVLDGQHGRLIV